ncbi:MAG: alpha/beta fold hydrolase [Planctomycetota bacterium]|nr:alpha/beta fold hydrolase [Planctomycetota bacterium]
MQAALRAKLQELDPALYPFENRYLDRGGLRYHYLDEGQGEPLVMVHGNPTWSFYFRNLVAAFRSHYRCVAPDHIGCGFSDKPGDERYAYTLDRRVDDLEALLERLGLREDLTLILHDWGGMIGLAYAARHPERVRRFVILNTSAFHLPASKPFPWQLWLTRTPLGALLVRGLNLFGRGAARACVTRRPLPPEVRAAYLAPYDSWAHRIAVLRFVQDIPLRPRDPGYETVSGVEQSLARFRDRPMLICWGEKDFVFDRHFLAEWERAFPGAELHRFPDCGHYILEDAGAEIAELVREFLDRHPLRAAGQA